MQRSLRAGDATSPAMPLVRPLTQSIEGGGGQKGGHGADTMSPT
jgi:hypothetical protein